MKIEIEKYRGWTISFDTEDETFLCYSDNYDSSKTKKSFSAVKKFIDDFIKENSTFKPFWVETDPYYSHKMEKKKIVGIRKDGKFFYEDAKGEKQLLSSYDERYYILGDEANDVHRIEAQKVSDEIEELVEKRNSILAKITGTKLQDFKKALEY